MKYPSEKALAFKHDVGLQGHARLKAGRCTKRIDFLLLERDSHPINWLFEREWDFRFVRIDCDP
ncbi:hypothetical protein CD351_14430 [Erythrobacter sp. KY5]|nr:hypothetical protein CD351_14430 [Erythrobacter sp. KY5]